MSNPKFFKWNDRIKSLGFAMKGIVTFFKTQPNAWIHLAAALTAIVCGTILEIDRAEWCWVVFSVALVIVAEMLNTALEFLTDLASPSIHPLAKKAKDVAAGAVLIAACTSLVIAGLVFLPKILA